MTNKPTKRFERLLDAMSHGVLEQGKPSTKAPSSSQTGGLQHGSNFWSAAGNSE